MNRVRYTKIKRITQTLALLLLANIPGISIAAVNADSVNTQSTNVTFATEDKLSVTFKTEAMEDGYQGPVAKAEITCFTCTPYDKIVYRWTPGSGSPVSMGGHPGGFIIPGSSDANNKLFVYLLGARGWIDDWFSYDESYGININTHDYFMRPAADIYRISLDVAIWK